MISRIGNSRDSRCSILDIRKKRETNIKKEEQKNRNNLNSRYCLPADEAGIIDPCKRQASSIEYRVSRRGFTLIEVMVTTAILSLGIVLVYNAFFISLDSFNYCSDYLAVAPWMDEKIWQTQEQLNSQGLSAQPPEKGQVRVNNKEFNWYLRCVPVTSAQDLFKIDLLLSWQQGSRNKKLSRAAYAIYEKE